MSKIRLAVIGVSGRNKMDFNLLSKEMFGYMMDNVEAYIKYHLETSNDKIILVSGGSAWADHSVVKLFLEKNFAGLELFLPTEFTNGKFKDSHQGSILNNLHKHFSEQIEENSLDQILDCILDPNCKVSVHNGFFKRNTLIAEESDHVIAFTFNENPKGGTLDTWNKIKHNNKLNINLSIYL